MAERANRPVNEDVDFYLIERKADLLKIYISRSNNKGFYKIKTILNAWENCPPLG